MRNALLFLLFHGNSWLNSVFNRTTDCIILNEDCRGVSYYLFTSNLQNNPYKLDPKVKNSFIKAPLISKKPLVIILHGYTGNVNYSPNMELRPSYFKKGTYNIISVDYSELVKQWCYPSSVYNADLIGKCIATTVKNLLDERSEDVSIETTHVVGFSLGAQISGSVGKYFNQYEKRKLPRITGLDPAMPIFDPYVTSDLYRLDSNDAEFVQIIHSRLMTRGIILPSGHLDFYINGGFQAGCNRNISCEHVRAVEVYAESLNSNKGFWGVPCEINLIKLYCVMSKKDSPKILLGDDANTNARGMYYVRTRQTMPYAL
ncbi:probable phospholipase A1 magnifin isoform X2 [Cimex lectularius]|uniref:Lipase domain-containing protein n=1 Tax=Cimex lectularius TaxID=79782 RepID=A0A8I6TH68_CIMLE|nr:probable phospholipase A1 magnifin isoform X2 [Cimex lectularius]